RPADPAIGAGAEEARDARRRGVAKGAGERDHLAHVVGKAARELARVDAAEAPADQADLPPVPRSQRREPLSERRGERAARPEVPTELPAVGMVPAGAERPAQRLRRAVGREPA